MALTIGAESHFCKDLFILFVCQDSGGGFNIKIHVDDEQNRNNEVCVEECSDISITIIVVDICIILMVDGVAKNPD